MRRQKNTGLSLRPPAPEERGLPQAVLDSALLLAGLLALLEAIAGFMTAGGWLPVLAAGLCGVLCFALSERFPRLRPAGAAVPALCLPAGLLGFRQVMSGWTAVYNSACAILTRARGRLFLPRESGGSAGQSAVLFCVLTALLLSLLCCLLTRRSRRLCGTGLCALTVCAALLLRPDGAESWMAIGLGCGALLLPEHVPGKRNGVFLTEMAACLALAAVLAAAAGAVPGVGDGSLFSAWGDGSRTRLHALRYESGQRVLPEGYLSGGVPAAAGGKTLLTVTMEQPCALYLRGFVGDVLEEDRWSALSRDTLAENADLFYWLHREGFYPQSQLWTAAGELEDPPETQTVTVSNDGACGAWRYTPYGLADAADAGLTLLSLEQSATPAGGWSGTRGYQFRMLAQPEQVVERVLEHYSGAGAADGDYLSAEGTYRAFLFRELLQLPEEWMDELGPLLDAACARYGAADSLTLEQAELSALRFLDEYTAGRQEGGTSLPLDETVGGTEYQTATLAVLALRYYGIPARYVEGFVLTREQAETLEPGQSAQLDASCAHAWAEVYQDGAGWLPLELTPGYTLLLDALSDQVREQTGLSGAGTGETSSLPQAQEPEEDPGQTPDQEEPQQEQTREQGLLLTRALRWIALALVVAAIILLAAILLRRRVLDARRKRRFMSEDPAETVRWVGWELDRLLPALGLDRQGGSFYALCRQAETLEPGYGVALDKMARCNSEAVFSSHPMTAEQADWARQFWRRTAALLTKKKKLPQRLWLRWIRCVY